MVVKNGLYFRSDLICLRRLGIRTTEFHDISWSVRSVHPKTVVASTPASEWNVRWLSRMRLECAGVDPHGWCGWCADDLAVVVVRNWTLVLYNWRTSFLSFVAVDQPLHFRDRHRRRSLMNRRPTTHTLTHAIHLRCFPVAIRHRWRLAGLRRSPAWKNFSTHNSLPNWCCFHFLRRHREQALVPLLTLDMREPF